MSNVIPIFEQHAPKGKALPQVKQEYDEFSEWDLM